MSRNAGIFAGKIQASYCFLTLLVPFWTAAQAAGGLSFFSEEQATTRSRVVIVHDPRATDAFEPQRSRVIEMVRRGVTNLTRTASAAAAWRSLVGTQDVVGIKVYSAPGRGIGTRTSVVSGVIEGLLAAGVPPRQIVIWDKHRADLREAGFFALAAQYGVQVESSAAAGHDEKTLYNPDQPLLGQLVWGDLEFGQKGEGIGKRSFISKLVSQRLTKIINMTPLLNHNRAGVCGNLYSLTMGSIDNSIRFETDRAALAQAVPEIYALPILGDRVVLNIVDALICQYQGEQQGMLHYSTALNELRFSTDPLALDILSLQELEAQRNTASMPKAGQNLELYQNASLLELGVSEPARIEIERLRVAP